MICLVSSYLFFLLFTAGTIFFFVHSIVHIGKAFTTKEWVERIIVAGVTTEPKNIHLIDAGIYRFYHYLVFVENILHRKVLFFSNLKLL